MIQTAQPHPLSPMRLARLHPTARTHPCAGPVVYYVADAHRWPYDPDADAAVVKIGTTINLPLRTEQYQRQRPGVRLVVLAWEPGDAALEAIRHREHAGLRWSGRRDWFHLGTPGLLDHVLALRDGRTFENVSPWE